MAGGGSTAGGGGGGGAEGADSQQAQRDGEGKGRKNTVKRVVDCKWKLLGVLSLNPDSNLFKQFL
jgi:hypothetical protein